MGNLGIGIGSFIEGLTKGANVAHQWEQDDLTNKYLQRRMDLLESEDKRAAAKNDLDLKIAQTALDNSQVDRAANAPLLDAQRKATLDKLSDDSDMRNTFRTGTDQVRRDYDALKSKSILVGKDDAGNPTFSVDGEKAASQDDADKLFEQRHGSFMDQYRTKMVPQIVQGYLRRGDTASADLFQKWSDTKDAEAGVHDYGRMSQALHLGDYEAASKYFNSMASNGGYISQDRHDIKVEPVKDDSGKVVSMRVTYGDKTTGANHVKDYSPDEFVQTAITMTAPNSAFEQAKADLAALRAAKTKRAEQRAELADKIELETAQQGGRVDLKQLEIAGKLAEKRAEGWGLDPKEYQKATIDVLKNMADNGMLTKAGPDGKAAPMTAEESIAAAADRVDQAVARQRSQGGAYAQQGAPMFASRPAPQQSAPAVSGRTVAAPPAKSILPARARLATRAAPAPVAAPAQRQLTPDQQYAIKHGFPAYYTPEDVDAALARR